MIEILGQTAKIKSCLRVTMETEYNISILKYTHISLNETTKIMWDTDPQLAISFHQTQLSVPGWVYN